MCFTPVSFSLTNGNDGFVKKEMSRDICKKKIHRVGELKSLRCVLVVASRMRQELVSKPLHSIWQSSQLVTFSEAALTQAISSFIGPQIIFVCH